MRKEISAPVMAVIVVLFVAVVAALGWYFINRPGAKTLTDADLAKQGAKTVGPGSGNNDQLGKPEKANN